MAKQDKEDIKEAMEKKKAIATQKEKQDFKDAAWEARKNLEDAAPPPQKMPLWKKLMILFVILLLLGAGGFFGYRHLKDENRYPNRKFEKISLDKEVLIFSFQRMRPVYTGLSQIDHEIVLIDHEIEKLDGIEKRFPNQKKITQGEKKLWNKVKSNLTKTLTKVEAKVEELYVMTLTNPEKGGKAMGKESEGLKKSIDSVLDAANKETERLKKPDTQKGIRERLIQLKEKVF